MIDDNNQNYQWRPAAKFDVGSIARFSSNGEEWSYGLLVGFAGSGSEFMYISQGTHLATDREQWRLCQIQYDANQLP